MAENNENCFMLGAIQVSPSHNTLVMDGETIKLQPKVMAVLHYLAANHARVISNEELMERLWEGRVVTHGSVQKSINALRTAFAELLGERDIIAHYSKRGYQLTLEPTFFAMDAPVLQAAEFIPLDKTLKPKNWLRKIRWFGAASLLVALLFGAYSLSIKTTPIVKHHKTNFSASQGYTNETGYERTAAPHPDNRHVAYIREKLSVTHPGEMESEILIRNRAGKDWRVASSNGSWFALAWSPAGKYLVALEVKHRNGLPLGSNFYEKQNYLYSFHIFGLDLEHDRLLEKQVLSQWQGRIFSVTWWDENTLEIVAKQGPNSGNGRYRYSIVNQQLKLLDELEGVSNLVASTILNKKTAVASLHKGMIQIDFLNEAQAHLNHVQLAVSAVDISWIPDGSGILVYAEEERKLFNLYLNGEQVQIPLVESNDKIFSHPRYSSDGNAIYYTEETCSSNIILTALDTSKAQLTRNTDLNYAATFSPDGDKIVYASVRNNQINLWLIEAGQEHQLSAQAIPKKVGAIVWSANGEHLVYNAGNDIYHYNLRTAETTLLLGSSDKIEPVAYFPDTHKLLAVKNGSDTRNLWRIDTKTQQQKQLTFGSLGSAVEYGGDVFFQYIGEHGLWVLRAQDDSLDPLAPNLDESSKLLKVDRHGTYFMSGGVCRESDIYYLQFESGVKSIFLKRNTSLLSTTSFNAQRGALQTECYLPEANVVLLK